MSESGPGGQVLDLGVRSWTWGSGLGPGGQVLDLGVRSCVATQGGARTEPSGVAVPPADRRQGGLQSPDSAGPTTRPVGRGCMIAHMSRSHASVLRLRNLAMQDLTPYPVHSLLTQLRHSEFRCSSNKLRRLYSRCQLIFGYCAGPVSTG